MRYNAGALYTSNGGIAPLNDSICVISGAYTYNLPGPINYASNQTYVTMNAGKLWTAAPFVIDAWGIYAQLSTGIFFIYPEGDSANITTPSATCWYSLDTGKHWKRGGGIPNSSNFYSITGDIEGDSVAIYTQTQGAGMFRSTDEGQTWNSVGGPQGGPETRFCVLSPCDGGAVIAFDGGGGVWLTQDGGDGKLGFPIPTGIFPSPDTTRLTSTCGDRLLIPVPMHGQSIDSITIQGTIISDSLHESYISGSNNFLLQSSDNDTLWINYLPHNGPHVSTINLNFQNAWRCADWADTQTIIVTTPATANVIAPSPLVGACNPVNGSGSIFLDSCQSLVITNVRVFSPLANRLTFQSTLPDTIRVGYHNQLHFQFDPHDTIANDSVRVEIKGLYLGSSAPFDTIITIPFTALGTAPYFSTKTDTLNFRTVVTCVGAYHDSVITFTNLGCAPDTITNLTLTGAGFTSGKDSLPIIVAPGDSVTFYYTFTPPDSGVFTGQVNLNVVSMGLTANQTVSLTGTGVQGFGVLSVPHTSLQAGSFSFCAGDTTLADTISNTGCDTLVISNLTFAGDTTFTLVPSPTDSLLLPGTSRIFQFHFAPRVKGAHAATLTFHSRNIVNDSGKTTTVSLAGTGLGGTKVLSADASVRDFGALYACQSRDTIVMLRNMGCDTLRIDSSQLSNGTYRTDGTYPLRIPPDSSAAVQVFLTADSLGMNGTLTFFADSGTVGTPVTIPLTASIIPPARLVLDLTPSDTAADGATVTCYVLLVGSVPSGAISSMNFSITHNDDVLEYENASGVTLSKTAGTSKQQVLQFSADHPPPPPSIGGGVDTMGTITFRAYLSDSGSTPLTLSNVQFTNALSLADNCVASIMDSSASFTYLYKCGEPLIQDALRGMLPFTITSIVPNPAGDEVEVRVAGGDPATLLHFEMYDALGRSALTPASPQPLSLLGEGLSVDVSHVPSGIYVVRVSSGGYVQSRSVAVQH